MKIEHLALNVPDPVAMARWYVDHLGFSVKRRYVEPPYGHFLADDSGQVMLELYGNPAAEQLNLPALAPAALHLAFVTKDAAADIRRLVAAGATHVSGVDIATNGDELAMLRDPWGFALQLVKRSQPML